MNQVALAGIITKEYERVPSEPVSVPEADEVGDVPPWADKNCRSCGGSGYTSLGGCYVCQKRLRAANGRSRRMANKDIGAELVKLVEADIGYAHISDGIEGLPKDRVLAIARGSLSRLESAAKKIRRFLKKHEAKHNG